MKPSLLSSALTAALLTLLACAPAARATALPSVESFFKNPATRATVLSPQGHYVAMVVLMDDGKQVVAIRDTSDLKQATAAITTPIDNQIVGIHWVNENRIGFTLMSDRVEFKGNRDEYAADRNGSNLVHLISGNWTHNQINLGSAMKDRTLTADYAYFDVTHDGSDDILVEKNTWNSTDLHPAQSHLYRLNTRNHALTDIEPGKQPNRALYWLPDPSDVPRVVTAKINGRCISSYRAPDSEQWTELANADCMQSNFAPLFFDGADALYGKADYHGYEALYRMNLKTLQRAPEPTLTVPGFDFRGAPVMNYASKRLLGVHLDSDAVSTVWFDARLKELQKKVDAALPQTINAIACADDCLKAPVVLVKSASDRQPVSYFIYTIATGNVVGLGSVHPDIKPAQMGTRAFYHYTARDGMSIPVYVTLPPGPAKTALPAVVLVHGGPQTRGASWEWDGEAQFLASRGYVVIQPEFRGGTGFGARHFQAGWKQWGQGMQRDLADAALWAEQKGWADPRRVAIMGASYGGYATLMGLIDDPDIFRCGVEWAGVTDIGLMFNTVDDDASEEDLQYGMRTLIGDPDKDTSLFQQYSPLANAARLKQPLLMAHGGQDRRVPPVHARKFRAAVSEGNPNVEFLFYDNEGHGWAHEEDNLDFWNHVEAFLDKNLKTAR
ncbi:alpha/beta fold hydrolase [Rugamonas sp.]|uniref:alpha/beta hydrolase family protein n=1 Tax=Rugamonas sp. TaxID=1926287 RepID=UPI0025FCEA44|nr:alpha/beta fold hydrolase [Rugamonas sp.]